MSFLLGLGFPFSFSILISTHLLLGLLLGLGLATPSFEMRWILSLSSISGRLKFTLALTAERSTRALWRGSSHLALGLVVVLVLGKLRMGKRMGLNLGFPSRYDSRSCEKRFTRRTQYLE